MSDKTDRIKDEKEALMQHYAAALQAALTVLDSDAAFRWRKMFGGAGYYINEKMTAADYGTGLALKLAEADREALLQIDGAEQSQSQQYIVVPPDWVENPQKLAPWLQKSIHYVHS